MAILSGHERRMKTVTDKDGNHIPVSEWTDADSITFKNGLQLDELIKPILKEDYDALSNEEKNNGSIYFIPDDNTSASTINYDNSNSELSSTDMQGAVDELAKPSYSESSTLTKLTSGEKLITSFGKIAKAISSLISHLADTVSHITSAERTKWNGYENSITNNATAISELNSDKQDVSTAINTSNIGNQYVNYANIAGNTSYLNGYVGDIKNSGLTYVQRDENGYIHTGYIENITPNNENPVVSQFIVSNGSDNYLRRANLQHVKNYLGFAEKPLTTSMALTCQAGVWRTYTFANLPTHSLSFPVIASATNSMIGCQVHRDFNVTGKIYVYSPVAQDVNVVLIMLG